MLGAISATVYNHQGPRVEHHHVLDALREAKRQPECEVFGFIARIQHFHNGFGNLARGLIQLRRHAAEDRNIRPFKRVVQKSHRHVCQVDATAARTRTLLFDRVTNPVDFPLVSRPGHSLPHRDSADHLDLQTDSIRFKQHLPEVIRNRHECIMAAHKKEQRAPTERLEINCRLADD